MKKMVRFEREASAVSPVIGIVSGGLFLSFFFEYAVVNSERVFASASNVCFLLAALYVHLYGTSRVQCSFDPDGEGCARQLLAGDSQSGSKTYFTSYLISNLETCAVVFITLLGASSLAFHTSGTLYTPVHTLDILFGWLLTLNLLFSTSASVLFSWIGRKGANRFHGAFFVFYLGIVSLFISFYDTIYKNQVAVLISIAATSIVFAVISRFTLVGRIPSGASVGFALVEVVALVSIAVCAVFCQGELLGRRLDRESDAAAYDIHHGIWHVLLSYVAGILTIRSLSVARMVEKEISVCVCYPHWTEIAGEGMVFAYALLALFLKEFAVDAQVAKIVLAFSSIILYVHALYAFFA